MPTVLRPMSLGEILDQTFRMYRSQFVLFVGIAAIPQLILFGMQTAFAVSQQGNPVKSATGGILTVLIAASVSIIAMTCSMAATVTAVSHIHLDRPITVSQAYAPLRKSFLRIFGVVVGMTLGVILGFIILIIPGIILALKWALAVPVAVFEEAGLSVATSRSSDLTKGSKGRIFTVMFVIAVLIWVVQAIAAIPVVAMVARSVQNGVMPLWVTGVNNAIGLLVNSLLGPLFTVAISLMYFDERVRKEAFDLQVLMGNTGIADAAAAGQA